MSSVIPARFVLRPQDVEVHHDAEQFDAEWDEEKHPRDERGRWASGGPGGTGPGTGKWGKAVSAYIHRETYDRIRGIQLKGRDYYSHDEHGTARYREAKDALASLRDAFAHAPVFDGIAYRGLAFPGENRGGISWRTGKPNPPDPPDARYRALSNLHAGSVLSLKCFQSFTASETVALNATSYGGWSTVVKDGDVVSRSRAPRGVTEKPNYYSAVLAITTDKARDVSHHAGNFRWQKEVLLGPTARIRVTKVEKDAQGRLWIHGRHL